ncbi:hypothetical protein L873DRAFT_306400 [Choiromyces venosus 120613-1]|uniref:Uncharacterized protein n=1 Tax=Choiromyces venosus 120613-1 TaxID=1336337 RepID=A0A3N4IZD6_9PEZI|nr:hypothetical protein L873DRAFT_306400 [Choiromyces venosus 120613-1]
MSFQKHTVAMTTLVSVYPQVPVSLRFCYCCMATAGARVPVERKAGGRLGGHSVGWIRHPGKTALYPNHKPPGDYIWNTYISKVFPRRGRRRENHSFPAAIRCSTAANNGETGQPKTPDKCLLEHEFQVGDVSASPKRPLETTMKRKTLFWGFIPLHHLGSIMFFFPFSTNK